MGIKIGIKSMRILMYNITWLRKHHKFSKLKMAWILGISVKKLNQIEKGIIPSELSMVVVFNILNRFGIDPSDLISRKLGE